MEKLAKNKSGSGLKIKDQILPLTNLDIERLGKVLKIKNFRGVFMKDQLPKKIREKECGIINLENYYQEGSHWVAYYKNKDEKYYFDSYGKLPPPRALDRYLGYKNIEQNKWRFKNYDDPPICGHLCLKVLKGLSKGKKYRDVLLGLY